MATTGITRAHKRVQCSAAAGCGGSRGRRLRTLTTKPTKPIITNPTPTYFRILKYSEKHVTHHASHVTHHTSRITQRWGRVVPSAGGACALVIQREASCTSHVTRHTSHISQASGAIQTRVGEAADGMRSIGGGVAMPTRSRRRVQVQNCTWGGGRGGTLVNCLTG